MYWFKEITWYALEIMILLLLRVLKIWILLVATPRKESQSRKIWTGQIPHEKKLNKQTKLSLTGNLFVPFAFSKRQPENRNHEVWVS